jgi:hypothetical protein
MEQEVLAPGVEHGGDAEFCTEMFLVASDRLEGLGGGGEEAVVDEALVAEGEGVEVVGDGEDDVEVGDRE